METESASSRLQACVCEGNTYRRVPHDRRRTQCTRGHASARTPAGGTQNWKGLVDWSVVVATSTATPCIHILHVGVTGQLQHQTCVTAMTAVCNEHVLANPVVCCFWQVAFATRHVLQRLLHMSQLTFMGMLSPACAVAFWTPNPCGHHHYWLPATNVFCTYLCRPPPLLHVLCQPLPTIPQLLHLPGPPPPIIVQFLHLRSPPPPTTFQLLDLPSPPPLRPPPHLLLPSLPAFPLPHATAPHQSPDSPPSQSTAPHPFQLHHYSFTLPQRHLLRSSACSCQQTDCTI